MRGPEVGEGQGLRMSRKRYLLTDEDFEGLATLIDRDPQYGVAGGSSGVLSEAEQAAHDKAHRFFNYQVRRWIARMKDGEK